jgi:hypothetical protein
VTEFHEGQRVKLLEFDNGDEIVPEQIATVVGVPDHGGDPYMVRVDTGGPHNPDDPDGLREVGDDQMVAL